MSRFIMVRALGAILLTGAVAAPALAGPPGPMRGYAPTTVAPVTAAPAPTSGTLVKTGRDRISLDRVRAGARVGDSLLRLAPTTNNGHFTQFENYQGSISATTRLDGDNYGTIVTNQNGNILGLVGNNGIVDSSALVGVDSQGKGK